MHFVQSEGAAIPLNGRGVSWRGHLQLLKALNSAAKSKHRETAIGLKVAEWGVKQ